MVVEGDRTALTITFASHKKDPWAGVRKGFTSAWRLTAFAADGTMLAEVPLDVSPFDVSQKGVGAPIRSEGCIVVDSHVHLLVNVPRFATAATYRFERTEPNGVRTFLGSVAASTVQDLAGEHR
jgi:hypothetical protein